MHLASPTPSFLKPKISKSVAGTPLRSNGEPAEVIEIDSDSDDDVPGKMPGEDDANSYRARSRTRFSTEPPEDPAELEVRRRAASLSWLRALTLAQRQRNAFRAKLEER